LKPADLLAFDDHVAQCERCRERLRGIAPLRPALASLRACMESTPVGDYPPGE
jgi:hypothetical protein